MCALNFRNIWVNLKIILGCCVTTAGVVAGVATCAVRLSHAPCCSLHSAEKPGRVANLTKRVMLAHSASFMV